MIMKKAFLLILVGILVFSALLFSGCISEKKEEVSTVATTTTTTTIVAVTSTAPAVEEAFKPIELVYKVKNFGPGKEVTATFWLEEQKKCGSRDAYLGIVKLAGDGSGFQGAMAKITVFKDNGEMAVSRFVSREEEMAFDDLTSIYNDFPLPLMVNSIFAYAGENFNSHKIWNATSPMILKNVDNGMSMANYSIIRQTEDASGILPCQKFKLIVKGTNVDGYFVACAAKPTEELRLPLTVSFAFENEQGPSWALLSYANRKSGIDWFPQCLNAVRCKYVPRWSDAQRRGCETGAGEVQAVTDEKDCITAYRCFTQDELVEQSISRVQRPGCGIDPGVKSKLLACRKNDQMNYDTIEYDEGGCLLDIRCRQ
jgi:hypothetical protein